MAFKTIKKVLLIEPPITRPLDFGAEKVRIGVLPPIGLAYLAAVLEKNNFEVKILDCLIHGSLKGIGYTKNQIRYGLSDEEIKQEIRRYEPDLVGISCSFSAKIYDVLNVCQIVKDINPDIITMVGGAHPTTACKEVIKDANLDFVVLGEGEYSTLDLIKTLSQRGDLSTIDGIVYKQNQEIKINPKTKFIENLDELPLPARHLLKMEKYIYTFSSHSGIKRQPFASMTSSRGCPHRCQYCVIRCIFGLKPRFRSAENVLSEIEHLINTYGIKEIHFEDDNLAADRERAKAIFQGIINKGWDLTLNSPSGLTVASLDEEMLRLMKKAGYYSISIGIESGDKDILRLMRKPVNLEKAQYVINTARKVGLTIKGFFILGYPGETKIQMQRTVDFARRANLDWALFFIATPIPGSELEKICQEKNYIKNQSRDYVRNFYESNIETPEFTPEYVEKFRQKANFEINFKNNTNIRLGNYDKAIEDIGSVAKLYPNLDFAHFYLGTAYEKKGLLDKAMQSFKRTLELNPGHQEAKEKLYASKIIAQEKTRT